MSLPADNYIISRDANEAERLEIQHQCLISCQGYYLSPEVSMPSASARIAELCTGTAIWLRELASANPTAECHGFDISRIMFPSPETLPPNVQLHTADIKKPFEDDWLGYFDVVHIRLIQAAMRVEECVTVLRNITTLLRPGGWLQWVEDDGPEAVRQSLRLIAPLGAAEQSLHQAQSQAEWRPPHFSYLSGLNPIIVPDDGALTTSYGSINLNFLMEDPEVGNLDRVACDVFAIDREDDGGKLRKAWATMEISAMWNMMKVREDVGVKIAYVGRDEWYERAMKEIEMGAHWVTCAIVFTGRKKF